MLVNCTNMMCTYAVDLHVLAFLQLIFCLVSRISRSRRLFSIFHTDSDIPHLKAEQHTLGRNPDSGPL